MSIQYSKILNTDILCQPTVCFLFTQLSNTKAMRKVQQVRFNRDFSCFVSCGDDGFRLYSVDPLMQLHHVKQEQIGMQPTFVIHVNYDNTNVFCKCCYLPLAHFLFWLISPLLYHPFSALIVWGFGSDWLWLVPFRCSHCVDMFDKSAHPVLTYHTLPYSRICLPYLYQIGLLQITIPLPVKEV